ncbi:MAG TPA: pilus assembly PilX N-terminal domain-containing protein, partial [Verrucomicrobiae bacterium]
MKRHSEKGMALVITLMMLAIVTFMAVVFLSLSRRERANVKISEEQATARLMADAGLERAKADMLAQMNNKVEDFLGQATNAPIYGKAIDQQHVATANGAVQRGLFAYDLRTSRNFVNPNGFKRADGAVPWNVSYVDKKGVLLDPASDDYYQNVANLQYDPRVPVIVTEGKTNDFRYYLDLNRNGMFDQNDLFEVIRYGNTAFGTPFYVTNRYSGDPEWIGVLERPDLPHSETNRFIGRYAYIMMPTGKSLDINFIHNMAVYDQTDLKFDGSRRRFSRNQGVGSWELNLAAFLVDLNTNVWKPNSTTFYNLNTNLASGIAFKDAVGLLQYRFNNSQTNLYTPKEVFGATNRWAVDFVDMNSDGPIIPYQFMYYSARPNFDLQTTSFRLENDRDDRYWHGADRAALTGEFPDVQRYFKLKTPAASAEQLEFYQNFTNAVSSSRTNIYDRFAYYRLLSQMGADSRPALQNKIHLNFVNEPGTISTNLLPWVTNSSLGAMPTAIIRSNTAVAVTRKDGGQEFVAQPNNLTNFFLIAANAMLRESLVTNVFIDDFGKWRTNYTIGCSYFHDPSLNTVWQDPTRRRYIVGAPVRP